MPAPYHYGYLVKGSGGEVQAMVWNNPPHSYVGSEDGHNFTDNGAFSLHKEDGWPPM